MLEKTNLKEIKEVAKMLLHLDLKTVAGFDGMFINHPFFDTAYYPGVNGKIVDIRKDKDSYEYIIKKQEQRIDTMIMPIMVFSIIRSPYRLTFYNLVKEYMNPKDAALCLRTSWQSSEFPNAPSDITLFQKLKFFKEIPKKYLMDQEEQEIYDSLPDEVTIYRGLQDDKAKIKALTWTTNKNTAVWFSKRWKKSNGVYKATIDKRYIY